MRSQEDRVHSLWTLLGTDFPFHVVLSFLYLQISPTMDTKLIIASLNVRGMNNPVKRSIAYSWMRRQNIDILRLQETYLQEPDPSWSNEFPDTEMYHSFGTKHSRGVSVMVQCPDLTVTLVTSESNGRIVTIYVQLYLLFPFT